MTEDEDLGWLFSSPMMIRALGQEPRRVVLSGYDDKVAHAAFHKAIDALLAADAGALQRAEPYVFSYYTDMRRLWEARGENTVGIASATQIWQHVRIGHEPMLSRRSDDQRVYVSIECSCAWERERGLQLVFDDTMTIVKVGPYDGHLTNADAYAKAALEGVVYVPMT